MQIQSKWDEMCDAYVNDEWSKLETVAKEVRQLLKGGATPIVARRDDLGHAFQLALAEAGVNFVLDRFEQHNV
jgi:hypothetical protein